MIVHAISAAPDVDAFTGGVVLVLSVVLISLATLGALGVARRILGA